MSETFDWRKLPEDELEQHFNPRVTISDVAARLESYGNRSRDARQAMSGEYDIRYGNRPKETLDLHLPPSTAKPPLLFFVHGGYWRALDKSDHSFVVPPYLNAGIAVANVNYDLCPDVTLDVMVEEVGAALRYCREHAGEWGVDSTRFYLAGHSAGAHLVASLLAQDSTDRGLPADEIKGAALLTGIYEPEVALHVSVNAEIQLVEAVAARHDYLRRPPRMGVPVFVSVGAEEPEGWIDQSRRYAAVCESAGLETDLQIIGSANHFTLLEYAATPGHALCEKLIALFSG